MAVGLGGLASIGAKGAHKVPGQWGTLGCWDVGDEGVCGRRTRALGVAACGGCGPRGDPDLPPPRVPKRPIINTPVVSISVHAAAGRAPRALEKPITLQFRLLETQERSKPICVFWNHSLL